MSASVESLGEVRLVPVSQLKAAKGNPRKIPAAAVSIVAKSLERFGWQQPIVVDADFVVIAGHTRLLAAKELKLGEVPVVVADSLSPDEVVAYRIADNRTHDFTSWDFPELLAQLDDLSAEFSDVLALADWQSIISDFEKLPDAEVEDDFASVAATSSEFEVTVVFVSKDAAMAAGPMIIDLPGVTDVRNKS
jgi:hypothetical protein